MKLQEDAISHVATKYWFKAVEQSGVKKDLLVQVGWLKAITPQSLNIDGSLIPTRGGYWREKNEELDLMETDKEYPWEKLEIKMNSHVIEDETISVHNETEMKEHAKNFKLPKIDLKDLVGWNNFSWGSRTEYVNNILSSKAVDCMHVHLDVLIGNFDTSIAEFSTYAYCESFIRDENREMVKRTQYKGFGLVDEEFQAIIIGEDGKVAKDFLQNPYRDLSGEVSGEPPSDDEEA